MQSHYTTEMGGVRKIDSETGSPNFKTPDPALWPSLPCFYIHSIYTIPFIPDPAFSQKFKSGPGSKKCSRTLHLLRIRLRAHLCYTDL